MSISSRTETVLLIPGLLFGWTVTLSLWLQAGSIQVVATMSLLTIVAVGGHIWLNKVAPNRDALLLPIALFLTAWGLLNIARVAPNFLARQLTWLVVGMLALCGIAASTDRLRWLRRFKYTWLLASIGLVAATLLLGVNPAGEGARRWLSVGGLFLQPSEVLRLLMVAFLAAFYSERTGLSQLTRRVGDRTALIPVTKQFSFLRTRFSSLIPFAPSFVMWLIAISIQSTQQDIGASVLLLVTFAFMLYLATGEPFLPLLGVVLMVVAIAIGYRFSPLITLRINIWLNPWLDPQGSSFQIVQSLITVASGGLIGQGTGQGRPIYVPAVHTDFPFAAITEEYGFIGAIALLTLFSILVIRAWRIMRGTQSAYVMLLAGGLAVLIATQVFVIVAGNLGLIPLTGVTVPFISYGGSSLLVSFISIGLLVRMSSDNVHTDTDIKSLAGNAVTSKTSSDLVLRATSKQREATRYTVGILLALMLSAAVVLTWWSLIHASDLTARDDNPRKTDVERAIIRGNIVSRDGTILAYSQPVSTTGEYSPPVFERMYPYLFAAPVVGYYSLWHGVGGSEAVADKQLRGVSTLTDQLLHRSPVGQPYTTTIDIALQRKLSAIMSGTVGAAINMDWHSGAVLALYSTPSYDPATLDHDWDVLRTRDDAPLLNRVTHGLYQPGGLLAWLYTTKLNQNRQTSGADAWDSTDRFELGKPVSFEFDNAAVPYPVTGSYSETIGQGTLRVTPLRIAVSAASLAANHGVTPHLTLYEAESPRQPGDTLLAQYIGSAQSSAGRYVGWYVAIDENTVTVIALESPSAELNQLLWMVAQLRSKN